MRLSLFSILIAIGHFSCVEKGNLPNEEEAYQVINWFLKRDTPPCLCKGYYLLVNRELDEFVVGVEDSIVLTARLSGEEIKNLIEQNKRSRSFLIDSNRIPSRRVISIDLVKSMKNQKTLWDFLKKDYDAEGVSTISYPLFSIDKSKAVIKVESYTETGGGGAIYLLGKSSGKWEILDQLQMWEND